MYEALERQAATVYRIALSRMVARADAEDVMQDVFVSYAKTLPKFNDLEHEKAWFIRAAVNRCNNLKRSVWHSRTERLPENLVHLDSVSGDVHMAMLSLDAKYRDVIYLHYFEGYETRRIAEVLSISNAAVKKRLERGRRTLRKILGGDYSDL